MCEQSRDAAMQELIENVFHQCDERLKAALSDREFLGELKYLESLRVWLRDEGINLPGEEHEATMTMKELVREYQRIMGWNDQTIISILCDYADTVQPCPGPVYESHLQEYLAQRAKEILDQEDFDTELSDKRVTEQGAANAQLV